MPMFAISAMDKPDSFDTRTRTRPDHLAYWEENTQSMVLAGPYLDGDGRAIGSLMIVAAPDGAAAKALADNDPYALAGVFASVDIKPWNWVIKRPEGL